MANPERKKHKWSLKRNVEKPSAQLNQEVAGPIEGSSSVKDIVATLPISAITEKGCTHHWIIESPNGATSMGQCQMCGEVREFRNSADDYISDGRPSKDEMLLDF